MSKELDPASFLGRGWSFPVRFSSSLSSLEMVEMDQDVRESLILLHSTYPGERATNPEFGCPIRDHVYDTIGPATIIRLKKIITRAVENYESRIELNDINITSDEQEGIIYINLDYTIRRVNMRTNIVYPYYKIEGTEIVEV